VRTWFTGFRGNEVGVGCRIGVTVVAGGVAINTPVDIKEDRNRTLEMRRRKSLGMAHLSMDEYSVF
jgi:hypothetical protein